MGCTNQLHLRLDGLQSLKSRGTPWVEGQSSQYSDDQSVFIIDNEIWLCPRCPKIPTSLLKRLFCDILHFERISYVCSCGNYQNFWSLVDINKWMVIIQSLCLMNKLHRFSRDFQHDVRCWFAQHDLRPMCCRLMISSAALREKNACWNRRVVNDHLAELKRFTVARDFNPFPDPVPEKTATSFTTYI